MGKIPTDPWIGIAGQVNDLHTVQQRAGDGVLVVGGGNEQNVAEVKGQLHEVIAEGHVLLGVKDLQQGRGGIALVVRAQLVDLVHQNGLIIVAKLTLVNAENKNIVYELPFYFGTLCS